jgi:signal transduction histidine kinase
MEVTDVKKRCEEDRSKLLGELASYIAATSSLFRGPTFVKTAREIFDIACEQTGATSGYIALMSEDGSNNEVLFLEAGGLPCTVDPTLPMPIRGLRADAYRSGSVVYENNFDDSRWKAFLPAGHVYMRNVMFAPLVIDQVTVGVMGLANKDGDFSEHDSEVAGRFGKLAAIALKLQRNMDEMLSQKQELSDYAHTIAHTLKNKLAIIASYADLMKDEPEQATYYNSKIQITISDLRGVLEKNLLLAKAGKIIQNPTAVDLNKTVYPLSEIIPANITIGVLPTIQGDMDLLREAFLNILKNAVDHGGATEICIEAESLTNYHKVTVTDNGCGIPDTLIGNIFDLGVTTGGTGIGLAIVRKVIQSHGGTITAYCAPGGGTAISLLFPKR